MEKQILQQILVLCVLAGWLIAFAILTEKSTKTHVHVDGTVYDRNLLMYNGTKIYFQYVDVPNAPSEWHAQKCTIASVGKNYEYFMGETIPIGDIEDAQCVVYKCTSFCPTDIPLYGMLLGATSFGFFTALIMFVRGIYEKRRVPPPHEEVLVQVNSAA